MSASKLHPKDYNGKPDPGGYIKPNDRMTNDRAPAHKGRIWVPEGGWYWLSGWPTQDGTGLRLKCEEMTDEQAEKYCAPRNTAPQYGQAPKSGYGQARGRPAPAPANTSSPQQQMEDFDDPIPF